MKTGTAILAAERSIQFSGLPSRSKYSPGEKANTPSTSPGCSPVIRSASAALYELPHNRTGPWAWCSRANATPATMSCSASVYPVALRAASARRAVWLATPRARPPLR